MSTAQTFSNISSNTLDIKGEKFVLLKKDYLQELVLLFNSVIGGEKLLKKGRARTFDSFLKSISKKNKK